MAEFFITQKHWNKVINYAKSAYKQFKCEIGGMMVMHKDKDGDYFMHDPEILKQEITAGNCILDKEALCLYYGTAYKKYKNKNRGKTRFVWWHSHHNMKAYFSSTDEKTIEECESEDFTVSLVVNIKQEYKLRVQYFHPTMIHEDVELYITGAKKVTIPQDITDKVAELCSEKKYSIGGVTTYKNGKKQTVYTSSDQQRDIWGNDDYADGYSYGGYNGYNSTYAPSDNKYIARDTLVTYMDSLNSQYCAGEIKYKVWKEALTKTNKALEEKTCDYRLVILPEKELEEVVYMAPPSQFIMHKAQFGGLLK